MRREDLKISNSQVNIQRRRTERERESIVGIGNHRVWSMDEEGAGAMGFPEFAWFPCPVLLAKRVSVDAQVFLRGLGSIDAVASIPSNSSNQPPSYLLRKEGSCSHNMGVEYAQGSWLESKNIGA